MRDIFKGERPFWFLCFILLYFKKLLDLVVSRPQLLLGFFFSLNIKFILGNGEFNCFGVFGISDPIKIP